MLFVLCSASDTGAVKGIIWGPELKNDCRAELLEAARLLITGLALANKLFEVHVDNEANPIFEEYQRLETMRASEQ
jgi:hypothetical protein